MASRRPRSAGPPGGRDRAVQRLLEGGQGPQALSTLKRVLTVLKVVVAQIDVLETMTPRQFLGFRGRLEAASGFQSAQFRELEAMLGRRDRHDRPVDRGELRVPPQMVEQQGTGGESVGDDEIGARPPDRRTTRRPRRPDAP